MPGCGDLLEKTLYHELAQILLMMKDENQSIHACG